MKVMKMKRFGLILMAVLMLCMAPLGALADMDDGIVMPVYIVDGLPATVRVYSVHFCSDSPIISDADLAAVSDAAWTGDIPDGAQKQSYPVRKDDGAVQLPYVSFMGESGMSGTMCYTFKKSGEDYSPIYNVLLDSHLTYNGKLEDVPGLSLDRTTGNFVLEVQSGDTIKLENFLTPEAGWDYSYKWSIAGATGFEDLAANTAVKYTVNAPDNQKVIQFNALHESPEGEIVYYDMVFKLKLVEGTSGAGSASKPAIPETGDHAPMLMWAALAVLGACGIVLLSRRCRKA